MKSISFLKLRNIFDNIFDTIFFERNRWMIDTIGCTNTRKKKSIKIIDFRNSTNRRTRIVWYCFLMDCNSRGESSNLPNMCCLRDIWDNCTSIRRKWLKISSLSFSIECIESKWGFPRTRNTRYNSKGIFWYRDRDIFEIVCFGTDNLDSFRHINKIKIQSLYSIQ